MTAVVRYGAGAGASMLIHGAAAIALLALLEPVKMPQQKLSPTQIDLATQKLRETAAAPRTPETASAPDRAPEQVAGLGTGVPSAAARPVTATGPAQQSTAPVSTAGRAVAPTGSADPVAALVVPARPQAAIRPPAQVASAAVPGTQSALSPDTPRVKAPAARPDSSTARAAEPDTAAAPAKTPDQTHVFAAAGNAARAPSPIPDAARVQAVNATSRATPTLPSDVARLAVLRVPDTQRMAGSTPAPVSAPPATADAVVAQTARASGLAAPAKAPNISPAGAVAAPARTALSVVSDTPSQIAAVVAPAAEVSERPAQGMVAPQPPAPSPLVPPGTPQAQAVQSAPLPSDAVTAQFGWSGAGQIALDADSLATVQAFLQPEAAPDGSSIRDRIAELMAAPDCARVQTVFDPDTGTLDLRGHVPSGDARAPLLAALRDRVGDGLPIRDSLRLLPSPQCDILGGMEGLGLPQSEEQLTDPMLIGENTQVREYSFRAGQLLTIELEAPDYPAYVYVDYYDSAGRVIHLMPNERTPLRAVDPGTAFAVGRAGEGGFELRIAPPYGQDIAVALASDVPLYDGVRPIIEPAADYLAFLKDRIAAVQPDKGEWVYLFVSTGP